MKKSGFIGFCFLVMAGSGAAESVVLSADELKAKVVEITAAQNQVMLRGSTAEDVDKLFALYSDDFVLSLIHI